MWLTLDDSHLTDEEYSLANTLAAVVNTHAPMVATSTMSVDVQPLTTVMVLQRPTEKLLLVIRADRSVVVATDDIYATRWRDA